MLVAVYEALANAVEHACNDRTSGVVVVDATYDPRPHVLDIHRKRPVVPPTLRTDGVRRTAQLPWFGSGFAGAVTEGAADRFFDQQGNEGADRRVGEPFFGGPHGEIDVEGWHGGEAGDESGDDRFDLQHLVLARQGTRVSGYGVGAVGHGVYLPSERGAGGPVVVFSGRLASGSGGGGDSGWVRAGRITSSRTSRANSAPSTIHTTTRPVG